MELGYSTGKKQKRWVKESSESGSKRAEKVGQKEYRKWAIKCRDSGPKGVECL